MPEEKKVVELRILENDFSVKAGESEDYIREIATFVNDELTKVKERNPFTNHIRIAILGCMNITELLFEAKKDVIIAERKQEEEANNINLVKEELKTAGEEINELKESKLQLVEEKEQLQKEIEEKNELLNQYREHLKQAKIESESNRKAILDLQNQLFESQIELVKANKKNPEEIDQDALQTDIEPEDSPNRPE
ncbi:cell division protein ZapA [Eubacterium maltosivorans]|uniref:cell division protein ZapA n=1 Tax=Eubacterium maltosivorans TaxID=2041044 RepID=UPI001FAE0669|nr:cell division protein ZapA [Eubacterium maltosivorans]